MHRELLHLPDALNRSAPRLSLHEVQILKVYGEATGWVRNANSLVGTISLLPATRALLSMSADPRLANESSTAEPVAAIVATTGRSIAALSRHAEEQDIAVPVVTLFQMK